MANSAQTHRRKAANPGPATFSGRCKLTSRKAAAYEAGNLQAALVILADADIYGEGLALEWARRIVEKNGPAQECERVS